MRFSQRKRAERLEKDLKRHGRVGDLLKGLGGASARVLRSLASVLEGKATSKDVDAVLGTLETATTKPRPKPKPVTSQPVKPFPQRSEQPGFLMQRCTSSNVYSFGYNPDTQTLRVVYLASRLGTALGGTRRGKATLETRVRGKSNSPGPVYDYQNVPPSVFRRMQAAASKGTFVWDALRVRGTIHGHKYDYALSSTHAHEQTTRSGGTIQRQYVPRKATPEGFKTRSLGVGGGKAIKSQLKERAFGRVQFGR